MQPSSSPTLGRRVRRTGLIVAGSLFLALGMVGVVIPVLPTTPFLLLAAICYGRSSERVYRWLVGNRLFGRYLDDYLQGRGIPWRAKASALVLLWGVITLSAVLFVSQWWIRAVLFAVAAGVTVHLLTLRGRSEQGLPESQYPSLPPSNRAVSRDPGVRRSSLSQRLARFRPARGRE